MEPREVTSQGESAAQQPRWERAVMLGGALLVLLSTVAWFLLGRPPQPAAGEDALPAHDAPAATAQPPAEPLPTTEALDALVRERLAAASPAPEWAAWLRETDLLRRFVAVVESMGEGESPRALLGFLAPPGRFEVRERRGRTVIAPASFARYDALGRTVASLDTQRLARAYRELRPLVARLHAEVAPPGRPFERALARAFEQVLAVPVPQGEVAVVPRGALYTYADPALEGLTPAQKHLLRMGPRNLQAVQGKVRELAAALGFAQH